MINQILVVAAAAAVAAVRVVVTAVRMNKVDARYTCNDEELSKLRKDGPWKNDAKWFQSIDVSPTAIMKMVRIYCVSTVVVDLIDVMFMSILMYLIMIE